MFAVSGIMISGPVELGWQGWRLPPQYFAILGLGFANLKAPERSLCFWPPPQNFGPCTALGFSVNILVWIHTISDFVAAIFLAK